MAKRKNHVVKRGNREERIQKRKQAVVTYFIVILMVSSVAGFALSGNMNSNSNQIEYNGYSFEQSIEPHPLVSGYTVNAFKEVTTDVIFYSSPYEAEQILITGNLTELLYNKPYYIYLFKPDTEFDSLHDWLRFNMAATTTKILIPAVTAPSDVYVNMPILSCANATLDMPVIEILQANKTTINITENGCVQIKSRPQDILFIRDRIYYSLSGIMDE